MVINYVEGGIKRDGGGGMKFFLFGKGGAEKVSDLRFSHFVALPPNPVFNDQSLTLVIFEDLFLFSPSEILWELCELMISISQRIG